jgi:hypothetical protein
MRRMAAFSSSPRRLLRRIRRRCFRTTSFPNPTMRSSMVTSSPLSLLLFFFSCRSAPPSPASSPSASRLFFRYRIPHALHSDWIKAKKKTQIGRINHRKPRRKKCTDREREEQEEQIGSHLTLGPEGPPRQSGVLVVWQSVHALGSPEAVRSSGSIDPLPFSTDEESISGARIGGSNTPEAAALPLLPHLRSAAAPQHPRTPRRRHGWCSAAAARSAGRSPLHGSTTTRESNLASKLGLAPATGREQ